MQVSLHSLPTGDCRPVIYVTGFPPFWEYEVNSSKEAVRGLKDLDLERKLGARIITETLRVNYSEISRIIPLRWNEYKPKLVVHVGMCNATGLLKLEQKAFNHGYEYRDDTKRVPEDNICVLGGREEIKSDLCMETVSHAISENKQLKLSSKTSSEPGRFVCGYVYYKSLCQDNSRSAFIHVPHISDCCSARDITAAIAAAIEDLYRQVLDKDSRN